MTRPNRAYFGISNAPGTSGDFTVSTAFDATFITLGAAHDGVTFPAVTIIEAGLGAEVRTGCTYTHGTTTLTRGTLESSTSGSAINFTSAAKVQITVSGDDVERYDALLQAITPGGRLTTESGVPVSTSDRTAQSTLYYVAFVHGMAPLWDGTQWVPTPIGSPSIVLSGLTSGRPYDVFGYASGGAMAMELLSWTNDTTRATAVTLQDGRYCKSGDKTRLLLGTIYTTGTNTTEDSQVNRYVANVYNAVPLRMFSCPAYVDNNTVTSYSHSSTTWSEANGGTGARLSYVLPLPAMATIGIQAVGDPGGVTSIGAGVGNDSATTASIELLGVTSARISASTSARFQQVPGRHFGALLLRVSGGTATIYADNNRSGGASDPALTHISGEVSV